MHTCNITRIALAFLAFAALAVAVFTGAAAWGLDLGVGLGLAAAARVLSGLIVAGASWLYDELRAWRWDAGQRLR